MDLSSQDLQKSDKIRRLNLVNSITGIKPANLIGTVSKSGIPNLAIFSSVVHIGSNPPLIGFMLRDDSQVRRDTYANLIETNQCTVNAIHTEFTEKAHYTAAKFDADESEFDKVGLTPEYRDGCDAPFVKESRLKFSLTFEQALPIGLNKSKLIIGSVKNVIIDDNAVSDIGYIDLETLDLAGISGLNSYYALTKAAEYPYARAKDLPLFQQPHHSA